MDCKHLIDFRPPALPEYFINVVDEAGELVVTDASYFIRFTLTFVGFGGYAAIRQVLASRKALLSRLPLGTFSLPLFCCANRPGRRNSLIRTNLRLCQWHILIYLSAQKKVQVYIQ